MAINPLLSLHTKTLDTATPVQNLAQMEVTAHNIARQKKQDQQQQEVQDLRKQKLSQDLLRQRFEMQDAKTQRTIRNNAIDSLQLKNTLESGGPQAALDWLQKNKQRNDQMGWDSQQTQEATDLINNGKIDQLKKHLDNNIYIGQALGQIATPDGHDVSIITHNLPNGQAQDYKKEGSQLVPFGVPYDRYSPSQMHTGDSGGMKASDTNAIYREAASLYGGIFDPQTGQFSGLDKNGAQNALALSERASQLYQQGNVSHSQAVAQAAREFGIKVQDIGQRAPDAQAAQHYMEHQYPAGPQMGPTKAAAQQMDNQPQVIRYDAQGNRIN